MGLKDKPRSAKSRSSSGSRPNTATTTRSVSSARSRRSTRSAKSSVTEKVYILPKPEPETPKRIGTPKEYLMYFFELWQPQLCSSYRPSVRYKPTRPDLLKAYVDAMAVDKPSPRVERFRVVEKVVETVNTFQHRGRESRMSLAQIRPPH